MNPALNAARVPAHDPCACAALRSASRAITRLYDLVLAPSGLKITQFIALNAIDAAGEISQAEFARQYSVSVETLSRRLGALRRKGYINVRIGGRHGERIYTVTDEGRKVLQECKPYWERAQDRLRQALGEQDWAVLFGFAERVGKAALQAEQLRTRNE